MRENFRLGSVWSLIWVTRWKDEVIMYVTPHEMWKILTLFPQHPQIQSENHAENKKKTTGVIGLIYTLFN